MVNVGEARETEPEPDETASGLIDGGAWICVAAELAQPMPLKGPFNTQRGQHHAYAEENEEKGARDEKEQKDRREGGERAEEGRRGEEKESRGKQTHLLNRAFLLSPSVSPFLFVLLLLSFPVTLCVGFGFLSLTVTRFLLLSASLPLSICLCPCFCFVFFCLCFSLCLSSLLAFHVYSVCSLLFVSLVFLLLAAK